MRIKPNVWVVGDSMLDVTVRSDRFKRTQEDVTVPVLPSVEPNMSNASPGGAANVAMNLVAMGCRTTLFTAVAEKHGDILLSKLNAAGIDVRLRTAKATTVKTRYYEGDRLIARSDCDGEAVSPWDAPESIPHPFERPDAIVVTDYGKGVLTYSTLREWVEWSRKRMIPIYGDPKLGRTSMWSSMRDVFLVANFDEACEYLVEPKGQQPSQLSAVTLVSKLGSDFHRRIVKCGKHGSVLGIGQNVECISPVHPQSVYDSQGAGDTYLAAMVAAMVRGADASHACWVASAAAGVAVGVSGTAVVALPEALAAIRDRFDPYSSPLTYDQAVLVARDFRRMGYTIALTNGCFDLALPHPGHIATLSKAASLADFLFVAVDSDKRVRMLKGEGRPNSPISERTAAVAALRGVHAVFEFNKSMSDVVEDFMPDYLVKGGDYSADQIDGVEHLHRWGGQLVLVDKVSTRSTTERLAASGGV